jgi:hypothetical protein
VVCWVLRVCVAPHIDSYGLSSGKPTPTNTLADAECAYLHLRDKLVPALIEQQSKGYAAAGAAAAHEKHAEPNDPEQPPPFNGKHRIVVYVQPSPPPPAVCRAALCCVVLTSFSCGGVVWQPQLWSVFGKWRHLPFGFQICERSMSHHLKRSRRAGARGKGRVEEGRRQA